MVDGSGSYNLRIISVPLCVGLACTVMQSQSSTDALTRFHTRLIAQYSMHKPRTRETSNFRGTLYYNQVVILVHAALKEKPYAIRYIRETIE